MWLLNKAIEEIISGYKDTKNMTEKTHSKMTSIKKKKKRNISEQRGNYQNRSSNIG